MSATMRASTDIVKRDLEMTCDSCYAIICDVEDGDSLDILTQMSAEHECTAVSA